MKKISLLIHCILYICCGFCQSTTDFPLTQGKCYVSLDIPMQYDTIIETYPVFIGENPQNYKLKTIELNIISTSEEKSDSLKKSEKKEITIVKKPKKLRDSIDFIWTDFVVERQFAIAEDKIWVEIECDSDKRIIWFKFGDENYALNNKTKEILDIEILERYLESPFKIFEIEIHTKCEGDFESNLELSAKRSQAILEYLIEKGVNKNQIDLIPKGSDVPLFSCDKGELPFLQSAANERIELRIKQR